jgi:biotin carboxylase
MKKVLVLGGGIGQLDFINFCVSQNCEVHIFDGSENPASLAINDSKVIHYCVDIRDSDSALQIARRILPDCVIAPSNDAGIIAAAVIAESLGLPGPGVYAAKLSRDKYRMRELTRESGIISPWFKKVEVGGDSDLLALSEVRFPCVVKPVNGSGSKGVFYVKEKNMLFESLEKSCRDSNITEILIEEFVPGIEYSLEGLVKDGNLEVVGICRKTRTNLPYLLDVDVVYPSGLSDDLKKSSIELAQEVSAVLKIQNAPIHMEFIVTPDGKVYLVEIAVRAAGFGLFTKLISWCIGANTSKLQLDLILNEPLSIDRDFAKKAGMLYFPQVMSEGVIAEITYNKSYLRQDSDCNVELTLLKQIGDHVRPAQNGSERIAYVFIFAKEISDLKKVRESLNFEVEFV